MKHFKATDIYKFYLSLKSTGDLMIANGVKYMPSKEKFDEFTSNIKAFIDEHVKLTEEEKLECEKSDAVITDFAQLSTKTVDEETPAVDESVSDLLVNVDAEERIEGEGEVEEIGSDSELGYICGLGYIRSLELTILLVYCFVNAGEYA